MRYPLLLALGFLFGGGGAHAERSVLDRESTRQAGAPIGECEHPPDSILARNRHGFTALWRLRGERSLFAVFSAPDLNYNHFLRWVRAHTSLNALGLLRNHRRIGQEFLSDPKLDEAARKNISKHLRNATYIIEGRVGNIHPVTCLESLPFQELFKLVDPARVKGVEFGATLYSRGNDLILVADIYDNAHGGSEQSAAAAEAGKALRRSGWRWDADYHNHPFDFSDRLGEVGGALVPSPADIEHYMEARPRAAWISNGLETVKIDGKHFPALANP